MIELIVLGIITIFALLTKMAPPLSEYAVLFKKLLAFICNSATVWKDDKNIAPPD